MRRAKTKREIIKELFDPSHYDPDTRPGEGTIDHHPHHHHQQHPQHQPQHQPQHIDHDSDEKSGPTEVMVNMFVRDFQQIDILKMEMSLQITFR